MPILCSTLYVRIGIAESALESTDQTTTLYVRIGTAEPALESTDQTTTLYVQIWTAEPALESYHNTIVFFGHRRTASETSRLGQSPGRNQYNVMYPLTTAPAF